jgi:hypothetical protein
LLGRESRNIGLFAKKAIALFLRDDDIPKTWKTVNQAAFDETADRHNAPA